MSHIAAICHRSLQYVTHRCNMSHIVAICHTSLQYVALSCNMSHIVAMCHMAVDMSNRGKICPYKIKKKCFRQTAPHIYAYRDEFYRFQCVLENNAGWLEFAQNKTKINKHNFCKKSWSF